MNLAYFRKSNRTYDDTIKHVQQQLTTHNLAILGITTLSGNTTTIVYFNNPTWTGNTLAVDKNLIGLLPTAIVISSSVDGVMVGVGNPNVLSSVAQHPAIHQLVSTMETKLKTIINSAANVADVKPTAITLYSTTTCPYCKMEASWLDSKKITYKEIKVDLDPQAGEEMVRKTGQMGVPVTAVHYDNGEEEYIVGFDQQKLQTIIGAMS